jgi:kynurenine formamidase
VTCSFCAAICGGSTFRVTVLIAQITFVRRTTITKRNMPSANPSSALQYPIYHSAISYTSNSSSLQTLDLWLPRAPSKSDSRDTIWVIYVHGGAWRDPMQDSQCVQPTIKHLQHGHADTLEKIVGIASINYRLSPYPSHPTDPSKPDDPQRNVRHPHHVQDVHSAIEYLKKEYGLARWIGVGHSCGATLLLQYVAGIGLSQACSTRPEALILLEGIYSIPLLLQHHLPPSCPENISRIYHDFIKGAFGESSTYDAQSPVSGAYTESAWPSARLVVLGHSAEDELVEVAQRDVMLARLEDEGWKDATAATRTVTIRDLAGGHDETWEDGLQIAGLIDDAVRFLHSD